MPNKTQSTQTKPEYMQLQVLLPSKVFATYEQVESLVVETPDGAVGVLPHRRDCVACIEPGILSYALAGQSQQYLALDEGVMVKVGQKVKLSVRNAHAGEGLAQLKQIVQSDFISLTEQDKEVRAVLARLESSFMRGFKSLNPR